MENCRVRSGGSLALGLYVLLFLWLWVLSENGIRYRCSYTVQCAQSTVWQISLTFWLNSSGWSAYT